jgi:hypothetical protein
MRSFLRTHTNIVLVSLAILFLSLIIAYFSWGIGYIVQELNRVDAARVPSSTPPSFNLQGAAALDYRGIVVATSSADSTSTQ